MCICIRQYHQISGLRLWAVLRRRNVAMGIDVRWVSRGRRDVVSYHKWMTSHNFFDFGVTCSTFISLCPNIRNTGLYFYLAFDFFKLRKNWRKCLFTRTNIASRCKMHPLSVENLSDSIHSYIYIFIKWHVPYIQNEVLISAEFIQILHYRLVVHLICQNHYFSSNNS
jgi:hypothetical protein